MENLILILNTILAFLLVVVILLQKSEGGALGLGVSQDSFISSRSASNFLTKTTAIIATLFIITSIALTIISNEQISNTSVLEKVEETDTTSEPEIPKSSIACRSISLMESVSASRIKFLVFGSICCQRSDWLINCLTKVFDSCIFLMLST